MVGKADKVVSICKTFMLHLETIFLIFCSWINLQGVPSYDGRGIVRLFVPGSVNAFELYVIMLSSSFRHKSCFSFLLQLLFIPTTKYIS